MATEYFGYQTVAGISDVGNVDTTFWNATKFTCPGSGSIRLVELSAYVKLPSGSGNILLAIYSADKSTKIAEGSAQVAAAGTSYSWQGHIGAANITPGEVYLTGGTEYIVAYTQDSTSVKVGVLIGGAYAGDDCDYENADYTGGFPASLGGGGGRDDSYLMRAGVDPAPASAAVTGTATASITEADIVAGGKTVVLTLTGDTFIAS